MRSNLQPINGYSYPFDFLRVPFRQAANKRMTLPKATGAGTALTAGGAVYAVSGTSGILTVTGSSSSGIQVGTAKAAATIDDTTADVLVSGNNAITTFEYRKNGILSEGCFVITGTATNLWSSNLGYITPAGDNSILVTDQTFDYLFDSEGLETLAVLYRAKQGALQNADTNLFQIGNNAKGSPGGMGIDVRTAGSHELELWPSDAAGNGGVTNKAWATTGSVEYWCHFLDKHTSDIYSGRSLDLPAGDAGSNSPDAVQDYITNYPFAGTASLFGFSLLGGIASNGAADGFINNTAGSLHISDFVILRNPCIYEDMVGVFADFDANYYEKRIQGLIGL